MTGRVQAQVLARMLSPDFDDWATAAAKVGHCAHPIRLRGCSLISLDADTWKVKARYDSDSEPLGVLHMPCGNRRASECPACSRVYAADTFQLIRAGRGRRQDRPTHRGGASAGVRHRHRSLVRARARPAGWSTLPPLPDQRAGLHV